MKTMQDAVDLLNEMVLLDPFLINQLIKSRMPCNENIIEHPTIQVMVGDEVGLLGVLNGIFADESDDVIVASWKDTTAKELIGFSVENKYDLTLSGDIK